MIQLSQRRLNSLIWCLSQRLKGIRLLDVLNIEYCIFMLADAGSKLMRSCATGIKLLVKLLLKHILSQSQTQSLLNPRAVRAPLSLR